MDDIKEKNSTLTVEVFGDSIGLTFRPTAFPFIREKGEKCFPQYKAMIDTVNTLKLSSTPFN